MARPQPGQKAAVSGMAEAHSGQEIDIVLSNPSHLSRTSCSEANSLGFNTKKIDAVQLEEYGLWKFRQRSLQPRGRSHLCSVPLVETM